MIDQLLFELPIFLGIIVVIYLTSVRFNWFSRHEMSRDIKPGYIESDKKVKAFFRFANNESDGDYRIVIPHNNEMIRLEDDAGNEQFRFEVEDGFLDSEDSVSLGRAAKMIGFIEWMGNPGFITVVFRWITALSKWLIYFAYFLAVFALFTPVFTDDVGIIPSFPIIIMVLTVILVGNIIMTIKDCIVYIWQNRYSVNMLEAYGVSPDVVKSVKRYLYLSMWCYYGISILKFAAIVIVMVFLNTYNVS